jgi:hypothetical protein
MLLMVVTSCVSQDLDKISRDLGLHVGFIKVSSETPMEVASEDHSPAEYFYV